MVASRPKQPSNQLEVATSVYSSSRHPSPWIDIEARDARRHRMSELRWNLSCPAELSS